MRGSHVRGHGGSAARRAALVIPAVVAAGFFIGLTRSADAADSTDAAGALESSSVTATSAPTTPVDAAATTTTTAATTAVVSATVETEPSVVTTSQPAPAPIIEPSVALAVEATEASTTPEALVAAAVTEAFVETTVAPPAQQSTCRSDLPGAVMTITMADISYECAVYPGGQSVIDAGVATVITAKESPWALAAGPGEAGTLWITGHRVSHGGPFAAVPDLGDGAIVTVSNGTVTASYVIVGRSYVEIRDGLAVDSSGHTTESATMDAVLRPDRNAEVAPRLLLQTCDTENFRWMIYADLIEG